MRFRQSMRLQQPTIAAFAAALGATLGAGAAAVAAETVDYAYDAQGRLVKVERSGTVNANVDTEYEYDDADNRTREKTTGSTNLPPP